MKNIITSLDAGKDSVKLMGSLVEEAANVKNIKKVHLKTKTFDLKQSYIEVQGNSFKVEYDGQEVIVGEQGTNRSLATSKTDSIHQIAAYTAITQLLEPETKDNHISIVLACPISVLRSDDAKAEYKELIKGDGPISIKVNDKDYTFTIDNIMLKAEGSGILYLVPEQFKDKKVIVIDFGGLNMTVTLYTNGVVANPDTDRFIEEYGAIKLVNTVKDELSAYKKGNLVEFEIAEKALNEGYLLDYGKPDAKSAEAINKAKERFFNEALKKIAMHGMDLSTLDSAIFVGGTSIHLEKCIDSLPNGYIASNSQWATAEGLYKIAVKKYAK